MGMGEGWGGRSEREGADGVAERKIILPCL